MKQLHVKNYWKVLYGGGAQTIGFLDAGNAPTFPSSGIVFAIPTIIRNLSIYCPKPGHTNITLTVLKNGVATSLAVTAATGVFIPVKDIINSVSFAAGDVIQGKFTGPSYFFGDAPSVGVCIETEAAENVYGQNAGSFGATGIIGGPFGNGHNSQYGGSLPPSGIIAGSNSRSYSAIPGILTGLASRIDIVPGAGVYIALIVKNGIAQDGSGGTVDTRCILTGATQFLYQSFSLPVAIQDVFDIITYRSGGSASASIQNCVTLNPTTFGRFMFCGGSNSAINSSLDYRWNDSTQDQQPEEEKSGIVGPGGVTVHGMYIHKRVPGGLTATTTNRLRRSSTDTSLSVTLTGQQNNGSSLGDEIFPEDSSIDIKCTNTNGGDGNSLFWSIPVSLIDTGSIIVQKVTDPLDATQSFSFLSPGLTPSSFSLVNGGVQSFNGLVPGVYSISETPVAGWSTEITVSNGDPPNAINLGVGEVVTVTVTNTFLSNPGSGIYKIVPGKRNDTLWNDTLTGTLDVKIP